MSSRDFVECVERLASDDLVNPFEPMMMEERVKPFLRFIGSPRGRVADYGCGDGLLLSILGRGLGFDIAGPYLEAAKNRGVSVIRHDLLTGFPEDYREYFDVGLCSEVLEHVLNIRLAIENVAETLKPGAILYIMVPWEEDLAKYEVYKDKYPFTHLRSFYIGTSKPYCIEKGGEHIPLFKQFDLLKMQPCYPYPTTRIRQLFKHFLYKLALPHWWVDKLLFKLGYRPVNMMFKLVKKA